MRSLSGSNLIIYLLVLGINFSIAQTAAVKFEVNIPPGSKSSDKGVYLAGSFNCWNPHDSLYLMKETGPDLYSLAVPLFEGQRYEYKYTLGSWETVETSSEGEQIKNRTMISQNGRIITDTVYRWNSPVKAQKGIAGTLNKEQMDILSKLKDEIGNKIEDKMKRAIEVLKKDNENMLSEKPDMTLKKKYHAEIVASLDSTLQIFSDVMWKISEMLTPEQKKEILSEMQASDNPGMLFDWISKAMETPQK